MFCFKVLLNNLKSSSNKFAIRTLASRRHNRRRTQEELEDSPLDDIQDAEYVNLSKLEQSSKEMYKNVELIRERERYLIVKQKYFKNNLPNFLSWNQKMKIRNLYNNNSEEWSIDKLSESFPALPYAISMIVKSKWMKSSPNKITKHDEAVEHNWAELGEGRLELPHDLLEHLKNFTNRESNTLHVLDRDSIHILTHPKHDPPPNSFEAIIASYEKIKPKKIEPTIENIENQQHKLLEAPDKERMKMESPDVLIKNEAVRSISKVKELKSDRFNRKSEPLFTVPGFNS